MKEYLAGKHYDTKEYHPPGNTVLYSKSRIDEDDQ